MDENPLTNGENYKITSYRRSSFQTPKQMGHSDRPQTKFGAR